MLREYSIDCSMIQNQLSHRCRNKTRVSKIEKSRRVETRWIVSRSSFEARLELHRDKFRTMEEALSKSVTGGPTLEQQRLFNRWTNPEDDRRSPLDPKVGAQRVYRESESLGENARCGVTVTRVSVSEPSRREKEPERGSFGAKQRIKKEEERKGKRNQSKCLERIRSSHRA